MLRGPPTQDVARRNEPIQQGNRGIHDSRFVVELNGQRQIDVETKQVSRVHGAILTKPRDAAKDDNTLNTLLIMQDIQDFLHQRSSAAMIGFAEVDTSDRYLVIHGILPTDCARCRLPQMRR